MRNSITKKYLFLLLLCIAAFKANSQSVGGTVSPTAVQVCPGASNSGLLNLINYTGNSFIWQSSTDGGLTWIPTGHTFPNNQSYNSITKTTCYRVIVQDGTWPPDTSTTTCITILPPSVGGTIVGGGTFCDSSGADTLFLTGYVKNVQYWQFSTNGGGLWTNVANTTDTLIHPNITVNTIYRAIVKNEPSCPADTSAQASIAIDSVTIAGTVSNSDTVCYASNGDTLNLSGNNGIILNWLSSTDAGVTWNIISNITSVQAYSNLTQTTWYAAMVKSGVCNTDTSSAAVITVVMPSVVYAGKDTSIVQGQFVMLNGVGNGTPIWYPSLGLNTDTVFKPVATPTATAAYILVVTDSNGCVNSDTVVITVTLPECGEIITNLFTPNGDGMNDAWYVRGIENCPDNEVSIYNIYGNKVYEKKGYLNDWQGTYKGNELPDGTYYYVLKFTDSGKVMKGSVDILRSK